MPLVLACVALSGCAAAQRASIAREAQTELIGMPKRDLLMCAGAPERQTTVDDVEVWTYTGGGDSRSVAVATSNHVAFGTTTRRYCEASFVIQDDKVVKLTYKGRTGGRSTKGEQCAFIVENCLRNG